MTRIAFITAHDVAVAPYQENAIRGLSRAGFEVTAICRKSGRPLLEDLMPADIHYVVHAPGTGLLGKAREHLRMTWDILKARRRHDIFFVYGLPATISAFFGLIGVSGRRVVYFNPDFLEPSQHPLRCFIEKRVARKAVAAILCEPNRARFFASYYRLKTRPLVVPSLLPRDWPIPPYDPSARDRLVKAVNGGGDTILVLHQSGYSRNRCSDVLVRALALLPERFALVFLGTNKDTESYRACQAQTRELNVTQRVVCLDQMPFPDLFQYTRVCDIGMLLYPDDSLGDFYAAPGRLTEYLACGLPLVTSDFPGFENLVLRYKLGACADPRDPASVARAIQEAAEMHGAESDLRARLRKTFEDRLCYDVFADRILTLFRQVVDTL